ncbi:uncharacterized protein PAC_08731 [Phialocephala subalpina]|uniref:Uncharacterized protein n=1 Tax=Phialocephala subalpina TaxID=576137 RepID=A0A1L7X1I2_9HELO|nr:uncharacterized protein PAC_08731 [Phialocephala subalpina]
MHHADTVKSIKVRMEVPLESTPPRTPSPAPRPKGKPKRKTSRKEWDTPICQRVNDLRYRKLCLKPQAISELTKVPRQTVIDICERDEDLLRRARPTRIKKYSISRETVLAIEKDMDGHWGRTLINAFKREGIGHIWAAEDKYLTPENIEERESFCRHEVETASEKEDVLEEKREGSYHQEATQKPAGQDTRGFGPEGLYNYCGYAHGTKFVLNAPDGFKNKSNIKQLKPFHPPNSPDLSLIENVWRILKQRVKKKAKNQAEQPMKVILLVLSLLHLSTVWGNLAHRTVAVLAQKHLTPNATLYIHSLLSTESLSAAAMWADKYKMWPQEKSGAEIPASFAGDLHCPLHVEGLLKGGNDIPVIWEGRRTNLHFVWDVLIPRSWTDSSWADEEKAAAEWAERLFNSSVTDGDDFFGTAQHTGRITNRAWFCGGQEEQMLGLPLWQNVASLEKGRQLCGRLNDRELAGGSNISIAALQFRLPPFAGSEVNESHWLLLRQGRKSKGGGERGVKNRTIHALFLGADDYQA